MQNKIHFTNKRISNIEIEIGIGKPNVQLIYK